MSHILVCGGAGYIGAHAAKQLHEQGHRVTVLDNFSTGHRAAVRWGELIEGNLLDTALLQSAFAAHRFDAVMHFAALSLVGESVREPYVYYRNNVAGTLNLLEAMHKAGVERLVFSSTAAVYGPGHASAIDESQPLAPINPYGASKAMVERMLSDAAIAYGLRSVSLRYFNAAGADPSGEIGESHMPETHLIPNVLTAAVADTPMRIFGVDYPTRDGTCVRDYVHVNDLAQAHLRALDYMSAHQGAHAFNLGSGNGFSVLEVIDVARRIAGRTVDCEHAPRRAGDPPILVASGEAARHMLGWEPEFTDLDSIIGTAWRWHTAPHY